MFIKNIIYINLDYRTDRCHQIEEELYALERHCVSDLNIQRYSAIRADPGIIGCGYSHLNSIKHAKKSGYPFVWIFEDDFIFTELMSNVIETLKKLDDLLIGDREPIDVIFLAYNSTEDTPYIGKNGVEIDYLVKTTNCQTASCYIICANYYDTLISNLEEGLQKLEDSNGILHHLYANDQYWKTLQERDNWVCVKPRFGKQRPSYSDNSKSFMDYDA
jgi:GR25 family glycosyltransferase involved in LPS biosynthesis